MPQNLGQPGFNPYNADIPGEGANDTATQPAQVYVDPITGQVNTNFGSGGGGGVPMPGTGSGLGAPDTTSGLGGAGMGDPATGALGAASTAGEGGVLDTIGSWFGGLSAADIAKYGLGGIQAYLALKKHPLQQLPFTPEQTAIQKAELGFINNSPTRNLLGNMLGSSLAAHNNEQVHLPPGMNGYQPMTGQSNGPRYDMPKLLGLLGSSMSNNAPPPGSTPPPATIGGAGGAGTGTPAAAPGAGGTGYGGTGTWADAPDRPGDPATNPSKTGNDVLLTPAEQAAFMSHVQTHGPAGGHAVANAVEQYPQLGVHGAIALHKMLAGQYGDGQYGSGQYGGGIYDARGGI